MPDRFSTAEKIGIVGSQRAAGTVSYLQSAHAHALSSTMRIASAEILLLRELVDILDTCPRSILHYFATADGIFI